MMEGYFLDSHLKNAGTPITNFNKANLTRQTGEWALIRTVEGAWAWGAARPPARAAELPFPAMHV